MLLSDRSDRAIKSPSIDLLVDFLNLRLYSVDGFTIRGWTGGQMHRWGWGRDCCWGLEMAKEDAGTGGASGT